jgi:hypothetical protein
VYDSAYVVEMKRRLAKFLEFSRHAKRDIGGEIEGASKRRRGRGKVQKYLVLLLITWFPL